MKNTSDSPCYYPMCWRPERKADRRSLPRHGAVQRILPEQEGFRVPVLMLARLRRMNAAGFPLLSTLTFLPLAGVAAILCLRGEEERIGRLVRGIALGTSLAVLALASLLWFGFDGASGAYQFQEHANWMPETGISYHMGVDGISVLFVLLTALLTPICILASWRCLLYTSPSPRD